MDSQVSQLVQRLRTNPTPEDIQEAANTIEAIRKTTLNLHDSPKSLLSQLTDWATRQ